MAKATFKMKFAGFSSGTGKKSGKPFFNLKLLEEVENFGRMEIQLTSVFGQKVPADIDLYELYDDVIVVLDVSSSGQRPQFVSMEKA